MTDRPCDWCGEFGLLRRFDIGCVCVGCYTHHEIRALSPLRVVALCDDGTTHPCGDGADARETCVACLDHNDPAIGPRRHSCSACGCTKPKTANLPRAIVRPRTP